MIHTHTSTLAHLYHALSSQCLQKPGVHRGIRIPPVLHSFCSMDSLKKGFLDRIYIRKNITSEIILLLSSTVTAFLKFLFFEKYLENIKQDNLTWLVKLSIRFSDGGLAFWRRIVFQVEGTTCSKEPRSWERLVSDCFSSFTFLKQCSENSFSQRPLKCWPTLGVVLDTIDPGVRAWVSPFWLLDWVPVSCSYRGLMMICESASE